jgi:nickel-dependent lactate racemase
VKVFEIKYGENGMIVLQLPADRVLADASAPRGEPLSDPAAAVAAAVTNPLAFPSLCRAVVPGDHVVLAIERGIPRVEAIVAGVAHALFEGGVAPADLEIVFAEDASSVELQNATSLLPEAARSHVRVSVHDPSESAELCYLAASHEGKPIYFNRRIGEADMVVPISTSRLPNSFGYVGEHGGLFPTFSDEATQQRFRAPSSSDWAAHRRRRREEADEAAWLLGIQFIVQITPGSGNSVLHVLAGSAPSVAKESQRLCEAAWLHRVPRRAGLVVATIEGGPEQQTWGNFARALFAAEQAVADGGAVVLCTDLCSPPGPALKTLANLEFEEEAGLLHALRRSRSQDASFASLLVEAKRRARVYLMSGLEEEVVEDLGVGCVTSADQVQRLSGQHRSCILLGNAQHAMLMTEEG